MEYKVDGIIKFQEDKLRPAHPASFSSPSGAQITLNSTDDNDLAVGITLEADSEANAKAMAEIELNRISNFLSYFHNIPISGNRITRMVPISMTPEGNIVPTAHLTGHGYLTAKASVVHGLGPKSVEELCHHLEKEYPDDFEDVVSRWKEAISAEALALGKYLLLYRLIESLFEGNKSNNTEKLTEWIKTKEPSVQIYYCNRRKCDITIYTRLRDNIHQKPKQKQFPFREINDALPKLQNLVKQAIGEKLEGQQEGFGKI